MKRLLVLAALCPLAACGPSEDEIRADERAKMLAERVAELEAEKEKAQQADDPEPEPEPEPTQPPEPVEPPPVKASGSAVENGGPAARLIGSYTAYIGNADLYNSDGKRLTAPWQVLRQDRANFHRYGVSQRGDQGDPFFSSAKNRAIMERMVANGTIEASAGRRVVNGNVTVQVDIYGNGSSGQRVNVTVR